MKHSAAQNKRIHFILKHDRRKGEIKLDSPTFDWQKMDSSERASAWPVIVNLMWFYEKEQIIDRTDLHPYLYKFMEDTCFSEDSINKFRKIADWNKSTHMGTIAFLYFNNINRTESSEWLIERIKSIIATEAAVEPVIEESVKPKQTVRENINQKLSDIIGELQGMEDNIIKSDIPKFDKWYNQNSVAALHCKKIIDYYKVRLTEVQEALAGNCEQLNEAYSVYSKKEIRKLIEWYSTLIEKTEEYYQWKQNNRAKRVRKPKTAEQIVRKLKYKQYCDDLKINSIDSKKIVGSDEVWLFCTKSRVLSVFKASELDKQLSCKGQQIVGFSPKLSCKKKIRNPSNVIPQLIEMGKVKARKQFESIRAKETPCKPRVSKDALIIKVF